MEWSAHPPLVGGGGVSFLLTMLCTFQAVFYAWISYGLVQVLNSYNCNLNVKFCFMHFLIQVSYSFPDSSDHFRYVFIR